MSGIKEHLLVSEHPIHILRKPVEVAQAEHSILRVANDLKFHFVVLDGDVTNNYISRVLNII